MKRSLCDDFLIDGTPMLTPDADVTITVTDLEGDSGMDESGVYHRCVTRSGVHKWGFSFMAMTLEEYSYLEKLFRGKVTFEFTFPGIDGTPQKATAYRTESSVSYYSKRLGLYNNLSFTIIQC